MLIGLYFGSFNPIHVGHLIIASHVANNTEVEQVWLIVSPQNPLKKVSTLLNEYHRLELVRIAIENDPLLKWSDVEFRLPRPSYTIDTITYLSEKYPEHTFAIVIGSDSFQNLKNWKNADLLLKHHLFYVYTRIGFNLSINSVNVKILNAPIIEISSTQIREAVKTNKSIRYLVPDNVREEIERGGYYKK